MCGLEKEAHRHLFYLVPAWHVQAFARGRHHCWQTNSIGV